MPILLHPKLVNDLKNTLYYPPFNDLPDVICNIVIYADDAIYSYCDQQSNFWQQLWLASESDQ